MSYCIDYANAIADAIWNDYQIDAYPDAEHPCELSFTEKRVSGVNYQRDGFTITVSNDIITEGLDVLIYVSFYDSRAVVSSRTQTANYKVRRKRLDDIEGEVANIKRVFEDMWGR